MVAKRALRNALPLGHASVALGHASMPLGCCPLCARPLVAGRSVDEHHLVPKSQGGRQTTTVHRICHRKIHATLSEKELARDFATWPALQAHPEIASFISWVQKKAPEYYDNRLKPARRR
jgi:5-methylcytosine-specific restriction endonuclease McrA